MQYVRLGNTGLKVSRLCFGTMTYGAKSWREWVLEEHEGRPFYRRAWEAGINFYDTANMYSVGVSEEITGRALRELAPRREDYVLATKVFNPMGKGPNDKGLSRKHILSQVDASLRRMGSEYIDLYIIHRWDNETPIEETMEALHDCVRAGKVRYLGASSMYAWQFAKAQTVAERNGWTRFVSMQNHYNLVYREEEREMIPLCRDQGVGITPWSPLARGFLIGNRAKGDDKTGANTATTRARTDEMAHRMYYAAGDFTIVDRVLELAKKHGVGPARVALGWMLHKLFVTAPIIAASKLPQFDDLLGALDFKLSAEEMAYLEEPYTPHRVLGHR
jgi:aryl-alcohol dehydrogenase-like predicted oxidoreductase